MSEVVCFGICDVDCSDCVPESVVCRLNVSECGSSLNSSCSHFFVSAGALAASKLPKSSGSPVMGASVSGDVSVDIDGNLKVCSAEEDKLYKDYLLSLGAQVEPGFDFYVDSAKASPKMPVFYGSNVMVGGGEQTNANCGRFMSFKGCLRTDLHDHVTLDGVDFAGKVYVHKVHAHCFKLSCPVCYPAWASREAGNISQRILKAQNGFTDDKGVYHVPLGVAEHIMVSLSRADYGLSYAEMMAKVKKVLYSRGCLGGVIIPHGFRYGKFDVVRGGIRNMRSWTFSPHFHVIGILKVSYSKCRACPKAAREYVTGGGKTVSVRGNEVVCAGCDGFEALTRRLFADSKELRKDGSPVRKGDGCIVKVGDARKSIKATAYYQLSHASYQVGSVRSHVAVWFGNLGYRKLKVTSKFIDMNCPICKHDLVKIKYVGSKLFSEGGLFGGKDLICDLVEVDSLHGGECLAWLEVPDSGQIGSGAY